MDNLNENNINQQSEEQVQKDESGITTEKKLTLKGIFLGDFLITDFLRRQSGLLILITIFPVVFFRYSLLFSQLRELQIRLLYSESLTPSFRVSSPPHSVFCYFHLISAECNFSAFLLFPFCCSTPRNAAGSELSIFSTFFIRCIWLLYTVSQC